MDKEDEVWRSQALENVQDFIGTEEDEGLRSNSGHLASYIHSLP
jgi:hypothetical protein